MSVKIHHLPTGRLLTPHFLRALHFAIREEQAAGAQVWVAAGHGPVLYPRSGGYRLVAVEGPSMLFRSGAGEDVRRVAAPATPPLRKRVAA